MATYQIPEPVSPAPVAADEVLQVASGDLRQSANKVCWPAQAAMEEKLTKAFAAEGVRLCRAHPCDDKLRHGFIPAMPSSRSMPCSGHLQHRSPSL